MHQCKPAFSEEYQCFLSRRAWLLLSLSEKPRPVSEVLEDMRDLWPDMTEETLAYQVKLAQKAGWDIQQDGRRYPTYQMSAHCKERFNNCGWRWI